MAGVGFELKKLFRTKGFLGAARAYVYSTIVTVGPFAFCTILIVTLLILLNYLKVPFKEKELFVATIVYAFIFSQIVSSGFRMIITRFIADTLYRRQFDDILPSLYGLLSIVVTVGGVIGVLFMYSSPLPFEVKLLSYLLYMALIVVFSMMEYLSTIKDYVKIVKSFVSGIAVSVIMAFVLLRLTNLREVVSLLLSMNSGFLITISMLISYLKSFFGRPSKSSTNYYRFLTYFDRFPSLFFVALFYTLGLYSHNFVFWASDLRVTVADTYVYAPIYDVPTFYAFLSILPSMIVFVVSVETSFYEKYRTYYNLITGKGNFEDIEDARKDMTRVLWAEIWNMMEIQLFFSLISIAAGYYLLPRIGFTQVSIDIFNILVLGAYMNAIMLVVILTLLYFEDRKGALFVSSSYLLTNVVFTYITLIYGENLYGLGFFMAAFLSLVMALIELVVYLRNIHYHTFCGQPIIQKEREGIFTNLVSFFERKQSFNKQTTN
ncbi:MAG: exopolysaccharide Pel transporter PelG [Actinobacteria bacterium]|nr:exopolysaccharide Pel transporter PelG [Actinomycetota bacterium]